MNSNPKFISNFQLFFFLVQSQLGIGLLSLPNLVETNAQSDGLISIMLAGLGIQLILFIYWSLSKRFPGYIYTQITKEVFGKFFGRLTNFVIYVYFILTAGLAVLLFVNLINAGLLPSTPRWVIAILIISSSVYLVVSDLRIIARFFVLASVFILFILFLSVLTFTLPTEFQNILPIGDSGLKNILHGSKESLISMLGFEGLLIIFPYIIQKGKGILKTISFANIFITLLYAYFLLICLISFSTTQIEQIREPVLYLFRGLSFQMLDRVDLIFLSIWAVPMTTSVIAYLFLAAKSINNESTYKRSVVISGLLILCLSLIPLEYETIETFSNYVSYLSYVIVFAIPTILLFFAILLNKRVGSAED